MRRLERQTAIVTGAGQGIGRAIARRFAQEGARVVIAELDRETGDKAAGEIAEETGAETCFVATDVSDPDSVARMAAATERRFGHASVLVNNAGINVFHRPLDLTDEDWRRCFAVDLDGAWICCRAVLPAMVAAGDGAIINIISNHSFSVIPGTFPYPVAKHGLLGLTRALALEYASAGIAINAISPGYTDTALAEAEFARAEDPVRARAETEAKQPVGRLCYPDEIAAIAALLASHEARFMIGENVVIDGGVSIRMYE
ncbi:SDR family oxidoreductase [Histidinibacterium lentulum]|uniref:SDR family oxidoreductase n=1 Tax=Histidinibacterium lentulum TaxID=2480588 RepID=A0A3N2R7M0_9RHOB|nr:SDR family oxidoreductase [Histidinibacterium lentulum]ROU03398.1 SDR family oxidoreductase [Histidinibacterium lentulum]